MKKKCFHTAECIVCGHKGRNFYENGNYKEIDICPKCGGAYIDNFKIEKYKSSCTQFRKNRVSMPLGVENTSYPLFQRIERERKEATTGDYINIRVPKPGDVPIVEFNGEVLENFESIKFVWVTSGDDSVFVLYQHFLDIQGLRTMDVEGEDHYERYRIGLGKESEVEKFRKKYQEI